MKVRCITAVVACLSAALSLRAQFVWTGSASGNIENAANWSPTPSPISQLTNANLTFGNATTTGILLDATAINAAFGVSNGTVAVNNVDFTSTTSNYSFSGTGTPSLAIGGGVTLSTASTVTINNTLKVILSAGALQTINTTSGATLNVLADISGPSAGLVKSGTGLLTLSGNNTFSGTFNGTDTQGTIVKAGQLTLNGGSITHTGAEFIVGNTSGDNGTAIIQSNGDVASSTGYIGAAAGSTGIVTVSGTGSTWSNTTYLYVGTAGTGTLNISNGGSVSGPNTSVGNNSGSTGTIVVSGSGSSLSNSSTLYVGSAGTGVLSVTNGGNVSDGVGVIGNNGGTTGNVATVDGSGSLWSNTSQLIVGNLSPATLIVSNGGTVSSGSGIVSNNTAATSTVRITGSNSAWTNSTGLGVGVSGIANLTVDSGAVVSVGSGSGTLTLGSSATGNGTVNIGGQASGAAAAPGFLHVSTITTGVGSGTVQFKTSSTSASPYYFTQDGTSGGAFISVTGTTKVTNSGGYNILPTGNSYSGGTTINGGTLIAGSSGALGSGTVTLNGGSLGNLNGVTTNNPITFNSGRLIGAGTFNTPIAVGANASIAPGFSPGTLTFSSGLTLAAGGQLEFEVQTAGSNTPGTGYDFVSVSGGSLDITATSATPFTIKVLSLNAGGTAGNVSDFSSSTSYSWRFATGFSGLGGFTGANQFLIDSSGFTNGLNGGTFSITLGTYTGNPALFLNFTPVPEPSTYALIAVGLGSLLLPALRRRQQS